MRRTLTSRRPSRSPEQRAARLQSGHLDRGGAVFLPGCAVQPQPLNGARLAPHRRPWTARRGGSRAAGRPPGAGRSPPSRPRSATARPGPRRPGRHRRPASPCPDPCPGCRAAESTHYGRFGFNRLRHHGPGSGRRLFPGPDPDRLSAHPQGGLRVRRAVQPRLSPRPGSPRPGTRAPGPGPTPDPGPRPPDLVPRTTEPQAASRKLTGSARRAAAAAGRSVPGPPTRRRPPPPPGPVLGDVRTAPRDLPPVTVGPARRRGRPRPGRTVRVDWRMTPAVGPRTADGRRCAASAWNRVFGTLCTAGDSNDERFRGACADSRRSAVGGLGYGGFVVAPLEPFRPSTSSTRRIPE
ncbi:hypothetical protein SANTM175S_10849 [Streptomyces antimycoticus]